MSGRTHAIVPAGLASLLFNADPLLTLTAALAGLAPDIDEPYSVMGQRFWFLSWWIKYLWGHRTISHSLLMVVMIGVAGLVVMIPLPVVCAICLGWGSHVLLDAASGGVMFWWPSKERWVLGRFPVYGVMDRALLVGGFLLFLVSFWIRVEHEVKTPIMPYVMGSATESGEWVSGDGRTMRRG
ncbi:MAG: metal-dependent hydrolase [Nitrospira sp. BO4]|jgi:inner membrane protein|nr:metal-dependent hydrolase [Nitrospira sp. BO4]